ncbi:MAG: glycogen debranching enzyme, partial [Simkaniaceae bacterium]|nr:glycogen debranching enzyme [Simkaniaceae bacterium]
RNETGSPMDAPPLIAEITKDPVLAPAKLIAEAWDPGGLYQVATFPSWRFATWNDRFRDDVRAFIRGDEGEEIRENMKSRLLGSPDLYGEKGSPLFGINFITAHDGFTLCDLVSYESKRNMANGEDNRDGSDHNTSCNYGTEGETDDPEIGKLRHRQMRNFLLALFVSQGVPMLLMGDEYGHTRFGNNNAYCHDNALNRFLWDRPPFLSDFIKRLIRIRKARPELRQERFVDKVTWEGEGYLGMNLEGRLFILFNPTKNVVSLPDKQEREGWQLLISTADEPVTNRFGPYTSAVFLAPSLCTRS